MEESLQKQIEKLYASINGLEAQRSVLGDSIVDPALTALRQKLADLEEQATTQVRPIEERCLVTILFIDMVGSTALAEKLDPEDWRQVITKLHARLAETVAAHQGSVAQYLGDGLLAFFGAKKATEHDPENAIRAALQAHVAAASEKVQLRSGIHSGLVVMGELGAAGHKEYTASGDAVNLAARLQSSAPPGGILISHDTYRFVRGVFDVTPCPPLVVKGKSEPLQTYLVRRAKPRPFRKTARGVSGVETRTVGRESEMLTLQAAYLQAYEQHRVVWAQIMGDPGIGKSRLLEDLSDWMDLREETYRLLRARAFPDDANQPFALIRRMWFDRFQIAEDTPLAQAEAKWVERFKEFSDLDEYEEPAQALGLLVGLSFKDSSFIGAMRNDPIQVKGRALVVSRQLIWSVCRRYPIVVLLEDLQWADRASWEYLSDVFLSAPAESPGNGIFILGTARQGWTPPESLASLLKIPSEENNSASNWRTLISLAPLSERASHELAQELLQRAVNIPDPVIDLLVKRSEGVPYYMEEIVNWLIDRGILDTHGEQWRFLPDRLKEEPLPATLQHLLLTRLSSLSQSDRAVLQRGSIFGRHFWTGGVEALGVQHSAEILEHLQMRGFIEVQFESAFQGDNEWSFHHNLLQEVAYESVLKRERAALHKMAAAWLERQANQAGRLDEFAGLLGEHTERAGELSIAADWYLRAGRRIAAQGSPREAKVFFTRAMDLLPPIDRERRWQALLGREETLSVLAEAEPWKADITALLDLARSFEDDNYLAEAYLRQAVFGNRRGDIHISELASREALAATRRCGNTLMEAKALALTAMAEVDRGDTTATRQKIEEALNLARSLNDENVLAFVLFRASYCYTILGDFASQYHLKIEQIELDHRLGNRAQEATGLGNLGNHYLKLGLYKQARAALEQASNICKSLGTRRSLAYDLINLASLCLATRDLRQAYQLAEEALQEISPFMDARGEASALNYNGRVLLAMGDVLGASRRFTKGQELTLSQQLFAMTCESRTGLATCAVLQGQLGDAHSLIYAVWDYLRDHGWVGLDSPGWVYRACAETFDALGEEENGMAVIESGYKALMEMADKINVPSWRQSFLENVPDNRAIIEIWERRKDWIQPG